MHIHAALIAAAFVAGCSSSSGTPPADVPPGADAVTWSYAQEVVRIDDKIAFELARVEAQPNSWMTHERLANAYMERGHLTGSYDDFGRAEASLRQAFAIAPEGSGPFFTQANLDFTLHRFEAASRSLDAAMALPGRSLEARASMVSLRGALAFAVGDYQVSLQAYEQAAKMGAGYTNDARIAQYMSRTGDYTAAEALIARAELGYHGRAQRPAAWFHLQRGLFDLDRGRLDEALVHYQRASAELPGWWLVDEHIAEIYALRGKHDVAYVMYTDLVFRTGSPELMGALADSCDALGYPGCAEHWVMEAGRTYAAQLDRFPEATYGHALDHVASHGNPEDAVALAEKNHALRADGDATTALAEAYASAGRLAEASSLLVQVEDTVWRTPDFHDFAAEIFAQVGDEDRADRHRLGALALRGQ